MSFNVLKKLICPLPLAFLNLRISLCGIKAARAVVKIAGLIFIPAGPLVARALLFKHGADSPV
ncbi:hypothetical protein UZ35_09245 [Heyndrickxia coagulans]|nr:hypothetical protein IE89_00485 [Heyndrickxia coagulans]KXT20495.1 hypothetical protein UZ35_09245 [Heyndrickxia coagulans]